MKGIFKFLGAFALAIGMAHVALAVCANTDFYCYESGPTGNLKTIAKIDSSGNQVLLGQILQGIAGSAQTSSVSSGNSFGHQANVLLAVGTNNAVEGSVIIASTTLSSSVTGSVSTVTGSQSVIGIAAGPITAGSAGTIYDSGFVLALATGAVTVGDILITTQTVTGQGYLTTNNSPTNATEVAVALTSEAAATNGLIRVKLIH